MIERFPHDSTISLASASELNETALSSSISALKASGSIKSSHSTKSHHRLTEIVEDVGETNVQEQQIEDVDSAARIVPSDDVGTKIYHLEARGDRLINGEQPSSTHKASLSLDKSLPSTPKESSTETMPGASQRPETQLKPSVDEHKLPESARPPANGHWNTYKYKPKVKLAPRPSVDHGRTRNSDTFSRPVSTLPAGIRLPSRPSTSTDRPQTQQAASKSLFSGSGRYHFASTAVSVISVTTTERPPSRAGSTVSAVTAPACANYPDSKASEVTSEKQRLMKALQKRKKNQMAKVAAQEQNLRPEPVYRLNDHSSDLESTALERHTYNDAESPAALAQSMSSNAIPHVLSTHTRELTDQPCEAPPVQNSQSAAVPDIVSTENEELVSSFHRDDKRSSSQDMNVSDLYAEEAQNTTNHEMIIEDGQQSKEQDTMDSKENAIRSNTLTVIESSSSDHKDLFKSDEYSKGQRLMPPSTESSGEHVVGAQSPADIALPPATEGEAVVLQSALVSDSDDAGSTPKQEAFTASPRNVPTEDEVSSKERPEVTETTSKDSDNVAIVEKAKERATIAPIKVAEADDTASLSGDSFLDELQTATVEEAKTVTVSKSPATSFFPGSSKSNSSRRSSECKMTRSNSSTMDSEIPPVPSAPISLITRMNSNPDDPNPGSRFVPSRSFSSPIDSVPIAAGLASPQTGNDFTSRASSIPPTQERLPEPSAPVSKKSGVSSLISQRIKALEKFSSSISPANNAAAAIVTPTLVSKRSASLATPPASSGADTPSLKSNYSKKDPYTTPSPSPHGNVMARKFRPVQSASSDAIPTRESMTVTARIVRNAPSLAPEKSTDISKTHNASLHHSPLTVQHKSSSFSKASKKSSRSKSRGSTSSMSSPRNSMTSMNGESFSSGRRSNTSREGSIDTVRPLSQSSDGHSINGGDKKESRRSRLMKRMSSITFSPRRTIAQALNPTLSDQPIIEHQEPEAVKGWGTAVTIGDLNVQFPDTLVSEAPCRKAASNSIFVSSGNDAIWRSILQATWCFLRHKWTR